MSTPRSTPRRLLLCAGLMLAWTTFTACSGADPAPSPSSSSAPSTPAPSGSPPSGSGLATPDPTGASSSPPVSEPTTTNTLPPPPRPSAPAPSTAGKLTEKVLPTPAGWKTVVSEGGEEEGYEGNGTWVHARDPRYAAQDAITIGCADVTRDDYPDPVAALEGTYQDRNGEPGIGLALQFADAQDAQAYFTRYREQVEACTDPDQVAATVVDSAAGLIDRRSYPDGEWTEMVARTGSRLTLVILSDPGHAITTAAAEKVLSDIASR